MNNDAYRYPVARRQAQLRGSACRITKGNPLPCRFATAIALWLAAVALQISGGTVFAQAYPTTAIRMISGVHPGSMPDVVGRMIAELLADRADMYFSPVPGALALIKSGKLRVLAMSSAKRSALFPEVPTTLELGYPDSDYNFWIGISAPVKTPRTIVQRLNKETSAAVTAPEMRDKFLNIGAEPLAMGVAEFEAMVRDALESNAVLIKTKGFRPE